MADQPSSCRLSDDDRPQVRDDARRELDARTIAWAHVAGMIAVFLFVLALIDGLLPLIRLLAR